jgi:hypothetical protein
LSAQDFAQRGPLEIVLAGDKLIDRGGAHRSLCCVTKISMALRIGRPRRLGGLKHS